MCFSRNAWEKCLALDPFQHQARTQLNSLSKPAEEDFLTDRGSYSALFGQPPEIPRVQPAPLGARSLAFLIDSLLFNFASAPFIALFVLYLLGSAEIEGDPFDWVYENRTQFQWGTSAVSFMVAALRSHAEHRRHPDVVNIVVENDLEADAFRAAVARAERAA